MKTRKQVKTSGSQWSQFTLLFANNPLCLSRRKNSVRRVNGRYQYILRAQMFLKLFEYSPFLLFLWTADLHHQSPIIVIIIITNHHHPPLLLRLFYWGAKLIFFLFQDSCGCLTLALKVNRFLAAAVVDFLLLHLNGNNQILVQYGIE